MEPGGSFWDLGAGVGKLVIAAAMGHNFEVGSRALRYCTSAVTMFARGRNVEESRIRHHGFAHLVQIDSLYAYIRCAAETRLSPSISCDCRTLALIEVAVSSSKAPSPLFAPSPRTMTDALNKPQSCYGVEVLAALRDASRPVLMRWRKEEVPIISDLRPTNAWMWTGVCGGCICTPLSIARASRSKYIIARRSNPI